MTKNGSYFRDQPLILSCQVECDPLCSIEWKKNEEVLKSFDSELIKTGQSLNNHEIQEESLFYQIKTRIRNEVEKDDTLSSVISYFRIKNNSWIQDNDTITCESEVEGFTPVRSSMIYRPNCKFLESQYV